MREGRRKNISSTYETERGFFTDQASSSTNWKWQTQITEKGLVQTPEAFSNDDLLLVLDSQNERIHSLCDDLVNRGNRVQGVPVEVLIGVLAEHSGGRVVTRSGDWVGGESVRFWRGVEGGPLPDELNVRVSTMRVKKRDVRDERDQRRRFDYACVASSTQR